MGVDDLGGKRLDRVERSEVELADLERSVRDVGTDVLLGGRRLLEVSGGHHDVGPLAGELTGRFEAESAVCSGYDGHPSGLVGDICCCPGHGVLS